ncbi:MAG: hypothetical protein HY049_17610 [Acidobacteria bacterium]|nr:hypothetical protein [Acidobacteriota bacterium]
MPRKPRPGREAGEIDRSASAPAESEFGPGGTERRIRVRDVDFGDFPQITPLNASFLPGARRLKLSLVIDGVDAEAATADLVESLTGFLPSLSRHRCCGGNSVRETFAGRDRRRGCAVDDRDPGVDLAHLVEHVWIDVQHYIARMERCSGVTCAWIEPPNRYDVFVECPDETVGRTCAGLALDLVEDLLAGRRPNPRYLCVIHVARLAHEHTGRALNPRLRPLVETWGRRNTLDAVEALWERGFLREMPVAFNFSGGALLAFVPREEPEASGLTWRAQAP